KSLSEIEFRKKITRALAITMKPLGIENDEIFDFQTQHTAIRIPLNQVIYIETSPQKHYVILHGTNNQITFRANLKDLEKASPSLVSCHRSYLINPKNIIRINKLKREVEMTDGSICPFSRTKAKMLMDTFKRRNLQ
ncbi:MAG: LytR/AlgR family response regulator transcription factor, partial [Anaerotignaceae bacterium]